MKIDNIKTQKKLVADWEHLMRTFIRPEDDACRSTLLKYMEQILFGLQEFLRYNVGITQKESLKDLGKRFTDFRIGELPEKKLADVISDLVEEVAPYAVNAQIKTEIAPNGNKQSADLPRLINILKQAGYSGWVALEYEAAEEPLDAIPGWLQQLKALVA